MKCNRLISLVFLGVLILVGCSNSADSVDSIINETKDSWFVGDPTYEERFSYAIGYLDDMFGEVIVTGESIEEKVIVLEFDCDAKKNYEMYDGWTLKQVNDYFTACGGDILDGTDLHDVTVYIEYYMGGERIAVGEFTYEDNDLILD